MVETGNPILDKNLECIARYNPKLTQDLLNLKSLTNQIELAETVTGEPILLYNKIPLHSEFNAEAEAKEIFLQAQNTLNSMHIIFGMGLGYLFKEFCEQSKGKVIVYEPNLEILRVTLELVDFSKELSQNNVKITSDISSFKSIFINEYSYKSDATFVFLDSYKQIYAEEIKEIYGQIELIKGICLAEYNTLKKSSTNAIEMMLKNIPYTINETPLMEFKDLYKGKTALIVSAGPTLDKNIETIKKNRDKVIIFCVGTALKALVKNGITPDFLNVIEINDISGQVEGIDLSDINLILEPYTHNVFHKMKTKRTLSFPTSSTHANKSWSLVTGVDISPYTAMGTVSYEALFSAKILGFDKIILVGQDLAYVNNQCYSKDSAYPELSYQINPETNQIEVQIRNLSNYVKSLIPESEKGREEDYKNYASYKIKNMNETLYFVKGISGEMIPTQGGYATFIEHFREFAANNKNLNLINTSMLGADIEGFKNLPLETALENVSPIKEKIELPQISEARFNYDKNMVLKNLIKEKDTLILISKEFEIAKEYGFKFSREFKRQRAITTESMKYFKLLVSVYDNIVKNYQYKNPIYHAIAFSDDIELQHLLKTTEIIDVESIQRIYEELQTYFNSVELRLIKVIALIQEQLDYMKIS